MNDTIKCLPCMVKEIDKCTHVAYRYACDDCEWDKLYRVAPMGVECPSCRKWMTTYVTLVVGKDGYW